tara:strand:- start:760 stop:1443 length:684 start_codon:yes stop_codon:yes gene_type:complete
MDFIGKALKNAAQLGQKAKNIAVLGKKILNPNINSNLPIRHEDIIYAEISRDIYNSPGNRKDMGEFEYDNDLGDSEEGVWISNSKAIIAYRGSVSKKDWLVSDVKILLGTEPSDSRVQKSIRFYDKVKEKYPNKTIVLTGHSLGGRIATLVSQATDSKVISFSTGCGMGCIKDYQKCKGDNPPSWCGLKRSHRIKGDPLSAADLYGNVNVYARRATAPHAHSMKNYI